MNERGFVGAVEEAGGVGADGDAGGVAELAGGEAEGPVVEGADGAAGFIDVAGGEVSAGVGAVVVDDVGLGFVEVDGELEAVDLDVLSLSFGELVKAAEGDPSHSGGYIIGGEGRGINGGDDWDDEGMA